MDGRACGIMPGCDRRLGRLARPLVRHRRANRVLAVAAAVGSDAINRGPAGRKEGCRVVAPWRAQALPFRRESEIY